MPTVTLGIPRPGNEGPGGEFALHPLHGMHDPTTATPPRAPQSIRRTAHIDMLRTDGIMGDLTLVGRTRDVFTGPDGTMTELDTAGLDATVDFMGGRTLTAIAVEPPDSRLDSLIGAMAAGGFRAKADASAPDLRERRDARYLLVDDIPVCTLISGHAVGASGERTGGSAAGYVPVADQCAGFVTGGTLMNSYATDGHSVVVTGPPAPDLRDPRDPGGWHEMPDLPATAMRRARRIDVRRASSSSAEYVIDAMFRDSYVRSDGLETIIHEYEVRGAFDRETARITSMEAIPHVLPWQECPGAAGSAAGTTGMTLSELHSRVRHELSGTSTCTHLNDLYRSLGDCTTMIDALEAIA